jgi:predicted PurR-regulated permease PerM
MTDSTTPSPSRGSASAQASGPNSPPATTPGERSFARRALIAVGLATGVAALALFLWYSMYVLLLAFAAVLVGVLLRGAAEWVGIRLGVGPGWGLGIVVLSLVAFFVLIGLFAAPSVVQQTENLADRLPQSMRKAEDTLRRYSWGRRVLGDQTPDPQQPPASQPATHPTSQPASQPATQPATGSATGHTSSPSEQPTLVAKVVQAGTGPQAMQRATRLANQLLQVLLALLVIIISGIYLAASPRMYVGGLLMLFPHARRPRYREVLGRLAFTIRWWMIAQLVPMAVIGALTAIGLKIIGVELWLILGLLAALFNFIPNFGPLISGVPAFLLALAESPTKAMWVVVLYIGAQSLEGYVLTPLVQRRAVELPPALLILFQVLAGLLLGAMGVVLAAPLLAVIVVAVKMLYVEDVMGDDAHVPGDAEAQAKPSA